MRIENFAQAIAAGCDIRQNESAFPSLLAAFADLKFFVAERVDVRCFATLDDGAGWPLRAQTSHEIGKTLGRTLDLDENTLGGIDHPAFEIQFSRQPVDERSKPDALDRAAYSDFHSPRAAAERGFTASGGRRRSRSGKQGTVQNQD